MCPLATVREMWSMLSEEARCKANAQIIRMCKGKATRMRLRGGSPQCKLLHD